MPRTLMAVHAHPDDECITTGGILARYAAEGVRVVLVTCTGGEVGEISDPALATPDNLAEVRAHELAEACRILGVTERFSLGYRDSGMMDTDDNANPACFWQADMDDAIGKVVAIVRRVRPDVIVTYNERGDYGHPDHINAHRVAVAAFHAAGDQARYPEHGDAPWSPRKLYYSAWPRTRFEQMRRLMREAGIADAMPDDEESGDWDIAVADELVTTAVDVSSVVAVKRAALAAHRTQMGADGFFMRMPESVWREVWGVEHFRRIESRVAAPNHEDDLFAGIGG